MKKRYIDNISGEILRDAFEKTIFALNFCDIIKCSLRDGIVQDI
jgi:hypothetical protein